VRSGQVASTLTGQVIFSTLLLVVTCPSFAFPVPPPILNRPAQQSGQVQNSQSGVQAAQTAAQQQDESSSSDSGAQAIQEDQPSQSGQNEVQNDSQSDGPTFEGCGLNRDAAIMKAELLMTQALGDKTVSGHRTLNNDQYARTVTENSTMLINGPVNVRAEWGGNGRVCVRIAQ